MALTLGSSTATVGTDFSTTVSGFTASSLDVGRRLVNDASGMFSLADGDATTMALTARGGALRAGQQTIAIDETIYTNGVPVTTRTGFAITVAQAAYVAPPTATVALPISPVAVGGAVSVAAPGVSGLTGPYTYRLLDAVGGREIRKMPSGITFTSGALGGTANDATGLYGVVIEVTGANRRAVVTQPFSVPIIAPQYGSSAGVLPVKTLTFSDITPLQFSDGTYLELAS